MDADVYNILLRLEEQYKKDLQAIVSKSFDLKIEKAKIEKKLEKVKIELSGYPQTEITNKDVTGHD